MLLEEGVCYDQCVLLAKLLAFARLHSVVQGQICLLLQVSPAFLLLHSSPYDEKDVFGGVSSKRSCRYSYHRSTSHASKVMLKILQARLQQYMNHELPDVQAGFGKGRGTRDQIANIWWIIEKAREFHKNIYFCFFEYAKTFDVWITINCGKF